MARTMTVALGPHYENFIQSTITFGRYNNASEVVRAALRRLEDDEAQLAASKVDTVSLDGALSSKQYTLSDNTLTVSGEDFAKVGDEGIIQLELLDGVSVTSIESDRIVWVDAN